MCFGNDSPPAAPVIPAPPPQPEILDFIDKISGQETITVIGEDGKKRRVTQRLPRTPEEEERFRSGERLMSNALRNIQTLYRYDPASAVDYAPIISTFSNLNRERMADLSKIADLGNIEEDIQNFKEMQKTVIDEEFAIKNRSMEENLAHSGRGSGTYSAERRAAMAKNEVLARQRAGVEASLYGEDLASRKLDRNQQAFGLREMGRQGKLEEAQMQYGLAKDHEADMERRRQLAIEENKGLYGIGAGIIGQDQAKAMGGNTAGQALDTFNSQASDSLGRYNADVNRQMANYKMQMDEFNAQPPTFGQTLVGLAGQGVGTYMQSRMGEMGRIHGGGLPSSGGYSSFGDWNKRRTAWR
jgi:hypothetical protein